MRGALPEGVPSLPRWLLPWRSARPSPVHFVTWRLGPAQPRMSPRERDLVCAVLLHDHGERYDLIAFVVMDDHVHVLVRPRRVGIDRVIRSWQSLSAHQFERLFRRVSPVWLDAGLRAVDGAAELRETAAGIIGNPWKRWPFNPGYRWVWEADGDGRPGRDEP